MAAFLHGPRAPRSRGTAHAIEAAMNSIFYIIGVVVVIVVILKLLGLF